jgi:hypothetical protein
MADATQYKFEYRDVVAALLKQNGIHSGKWTLSFEIAFLAGLFGASQADAKPGSAAVIQRIVLTQPGEPAPPESLVVDAAEVNPVPAGVRKARRSRQAAS